MKPRILFLDIETFPILGWAWGVYEVNLLKVEKPTILCCFSAKWLHGRQVTKALPDYKRYRQGKENDKKLIEDIWKLLDEANVVIAQNGDNFDIKMINTEFVKHGMEPPSPYITIDTLKAARRAFRFPSNKLDDLGDQLEEGRKVETGGKDLWFKCMENDPKAWKKMKKYNAQDVLLLERIYKRFIPWLKSASHLIKKSEMKCVRCGSEKLWSRGKERRETGILYKRFQCQSCGKWMNKKL